LNDAWNIPGFTVQNENWGSTLNTGGAPAPTLPDNVKTVTVTGTFLDDQGRPANGRFTFDPSTERLVDPLTGLVIRLRRREAQVVNGTMSVDLIAGDNEALSPKNFTYKVSGTVGGQQQAPFNFFLPSSVTTVALGALAQVPSSMGVINIPNTTGTQGEPGPGGESAYQIAIDNGFTGTAVEWLATLVGPQGVQGEPGATGPAGATGAQGLQGVPGPTGDTGPAGATGATGPQGPKGDTGAAGADGATGPQGVAGPQGSVGPQGAQGNPTTVNGKSGASITLTSTDVGADASGAATSAVSAHVAAADPHGDRADAATKYLPVTGGTLSGGLTGTTFTGSGTTQLGNLRLGSGSSFGGANGGALLFQNVTTPPTANPSSSGGVAYVENGVFKVRGSDGTTFDTSSAVSSPVPVDHGLIAWTQDPATVNPSGVALSSGALALSKVFIRNTKTAANFWYAVTNVGAGLSGAYVGLYNSSGTLIDQSPDQSTAMTSTGTKQAAMGVSHSLTPGWYWVAFLVSAGTTMPTVARGTNAILGMGNVNLTAATYRFGAYGSGLTSLPGSLVLANITNVANGTVWAGLS
jgi:hypothetical protein